jgi:hypothetical protein
VIIGRGHSLAERSATFFANRHSTKAPRFDMQHLTESLRLFTEIGDVEHIGFAHLSIAEVLIKWGSNHAEDALQHLHTSGSALAQVGTIEGQGRVLEQNARYHLVLSKRMRRGERRKRHLQEAKALANTARKLFIRIGSGRLAGRIDGLLREIEDKSV